MCLIELATPIRLSGFDRIDHIKHRIPRKDSHEDFSRDFDNIPDRAFYTNKRDFPLDNRLVSFGNFHSENQDRLIKESISSS